MTWHTKKRRTKTRLQELEEACAEANCFVKTYSPGDGVTRYRFFDLGHTNPKGQSYFGPDNGIYTALGMKEAWTFVYGRAQ